MDYRNRLDRIHRMDEKLTYWMYYTGKWQYAIEKVPGEELELFTRVHPDATQIRDEETISYIERKWNE